MPGLDGPCDVTPQEATPEQAALRLLEEAGMTLEEAQAGVEALARMMRAFGLSLVEAGRTAAFLASRPRGGA